MSKSPLTNFLHMQLLQIQCHFVGPLAVPKVCITVLCCSARLWFYNLFYCCALKVCKHFHYRKFLLLLCKVCSSFYRLRMAGKSEIYLFYKCTFFSLLCLNIFTIQLFLESLHFFLRIFLCPDSFQACHCTDREK